MRFFHICKVEKFIGVDKPCCYNEVLIVGHIYSFVVTLYFPKMRDWFRNRLALGDSRKFCIEVASYISLVITRFVYGKLALQCLFSDLRRVCTCKWLLNSYLVNNE